MFAKSIHNYYMKSKRKKFLLFILLAIFLFIACLFTPTKYEIYSNKEDEDIAIFIEKALSKKVPKNLVTKKSDIELEFSNIKYVCYSKTIYDVYVEDILKFLNFSSPKANHLQYVRTEYGDSAFMLLIIDKNYDILPIYSIGWEIEVIENRKFVPIVEKGARCSEPNGNLKLKIETAIGEEKQKIIIK